jgi:hypothetical protein
VQADALTWTDPSTGLMWARKDNGRDVSWQQATDYCRNLQLASHSDWRLPTIDELKGIYDPNVHVTGLHVKGNLKLSNWEWSSSPGNASGEALGLRFDNGQRYSGPPDGSDGLSALCVRGSASKGPIPAVNPAPVVSIPSNSISVNPPPTIYVPVNPQSINPSSIRPPSNPTPATPQPVANSNLVWTDPATGLMWTKKDNGYDLDLPKATNYCRNLQLDNHSDWRLPTIDELQGIYDPNANVNSYYRVKGNLQLSGWQWSSSQVSTSGREQAWTFDFVGGKRYLSGTAGNYEDRALCVRRQAK